MNEPFLLYFIAIGALLQVVLTGMVFARGRQASREGTALHLELYGIMKKIEGLSAGKRALIASQIDSLLERLSYQLPSRISARAGEMIYETESQLLKTLSELSPEIQENPSAKERINTLVSSMERLEATLVTLTQESVRQAILDTKTALLEEQRSLDI